MRDEDARERCFGKKRSTAGVKIQTFRNKTVLGIVLAGGFTALREVV